VHELYRRRVVRAAGEVEDLDFHDLRPRDASISASTGHALVDLERFKARLHFRWAPLRQSSKGSDLFANHAELLDDDVTYVMAGLDGRTLPLQVPLTSLDPL
jgi:hypothetical protein